MRKLIHVLGRIEWIRIGMAYGYSWAFVLYTYAFCIYWNAKGRNPVEVLQERSEKHNREMMDKLKTTNEPLWRRLQEIQKDDPAAPSAKK